MKLAAEHMLHRTKLCGADWSLIGTVLAIKLLVLFFGATTYQVATNRPIGLPRGVLEIWNQYDARHYLDLARNGYEATGNQRLWIVFYPLYPWTTRLVAILLRDYLISAFVVSALASLAAALLFERLVQLDHPTEIARRTVWFLFIFPTSYFLHIGYTESLFLALLFGCFLSVRKEQWLLAGVLGALASLTRVNGLLLVPALAVEALHQYSVTRRWQWQWLWVGLVPLGFCVYLLAVYRATGNAFAFTTVQRENWNKSFAPPWVGIREMLDRAASRGPRFAHTRGVYELLFVLLNLGATLLASVKLRPSYAVWMAGNLLLFASTSQITSTPRYTLVMFPLFILFARLAADRTWNAVITVWSLLFLALFATLFLQTLGGF